MTTLATAMRAANVADFYMTKYLSKAQEALGPVIQPFIAGMRRIATAESALEAAESTSNVHGKEYADSSSVRIAQCGYLRASSAYFWPQAIVASKQNVPPRSSLAKASQ